MIIIQGPPIPQKRPRIVQVRGKMLAFNPNAKELKRAKESVRPQIKECIKESVEIDIIFYMQIPKSLSKKKQIALDGSWHDKTPDIDNCAKFTFDVLNGIAYDDDSQICEVHAKKIYDKNPRTEIIIKRKL